MRGVSGRTGYLADPSRGAVTNINNGSLGAKLLAGQPSCTRAEQLALRNTYTLGLMCGEGGYVASEKACSQTASRSVSEVARDHLDSGSGLARTRADL